MIKNCDQCGTEIKDGKCECGEWTTAEENKNDPMKLALEQFHEMRKMISTGDAPHLGCAVVFFRGDYPDCLRVAQFIRELKGRPHYSDVNDE